MFVFVKNKEVSKHTVNSGSKQIYTEHILITCALKRLKNDSSEHNPDY